MLNFALPIILVIASNTFYHIIAKGTPQNANPMASLFTTYLASAAVTFTMLLFNSGDRGLTGEFKNLNWTSLLLGLTIVGLEYGWIQAYRVGWNISIGSLTANICLAVVLIIIGAMLYNEQISLRQIAGICLCLSGLVLISKK